MVWDGAVWTGLRSSQKHPAASVPGARTTPTLLHPSSTEHELIAAVPPKLTDLTNAEQTECWAYQMCSGSSNSILIHLRRNLGVPVWLKPWTGSCSTHRNVLRSSRIVQGPGSWSFWIVSCSWRVNLDTFSCSRYNSNTHLNAFLSRGGLLN